MNHLAEKIHERVVSAKDLAWLMLGEKIGSGSSRDVYACPTDKTLVIKYEHAESFQNHLEWEIWQLVKGTKWAKWFAPCVNISPNGLFLIQKRAEKSKKMDYPKQIPFFFTDLKYDNFGFIGKQFVCVDYGTALCRFINTDTKLKMRKADWWE